MGVEPSGKKTEVRRTRLLELVAERYARSRPNRTYDILLSSLRQRLWEKQKLEREINELNAELEAELQRENRRPEFT